MNPANPANPVTTQAPSVLTGAWENRGDFGDVAPPMLSRQPGEPELRGTSLFHLLEYLAFRQHAGLLRLEGKDLVVSILLTGGHVHSFRVEGTDLEAEAVRVLKSTRDVTDEAARVALERAKQENKRPTYLLFERQQVTAGQVVPAVRRAQRNLLRRLMIPGGGRFSLSPAAGADGTGSDPVQTDFRAIVVGILRDLLEGLNYPQLMPMLLPLSGRYLRADPEKRAALPGLRLSPKERHTVESVLTGNHLLQQVFDLSLVDRHACARLVYVLFAFGALEVHAQSRDRKAEETPREVLERMLREKSDADHFALLGLHWTCHPDDIERAEAALEKRFGPHARVRTLPDCAELADSLYRRMSEALETLKDPGGRRAYRLALQGEEKVAQAAKFLAQQADETVIADHGKARRLIECAIDLSDDASFVEWKTKLGL
jgi:hypothetical protein